MSVKSMKITDMITVISEVLPAILAGAYYFRNYKPMVPGKEDFRISGELFLELPSNGSAMAFMYSVVNLG